MGAVSTRNVCVSLNRGLASPATYQLAIKLRCGPTQLASRPYGLTQEASKQAWVEDVTRMRDRLIFDLTAVPEVTWDFMDIVHQDAELCPRRPGNQCHRTCDEETWLWRI